MNYKNYDINAPEFDSKIKYYFSLFFISIKSYEVLRDTYGEDLNLFKNEAEINSVNNYKNISLIFENLNNKNKRNRNSWLPSFPWFYCHLNLHFVPIYATFIAKVSCLSKLLSLRKSSIEQKNLA